MILPSLLQRVSSACAVLLAFAVSSDSLTAQPKPQTEGPDTLVKDFDRDGIQGKRQAEHGEDDR